MQAAPAAPGDAAASEGRFFALDTLRYLFAAVVVLGHACGWVATVPGGGLAVDFFFVLSGFVLSHSLLQAGPDAATPGSFCVARIARLLPMYLLTLSLALLAVTLNGYTVHLDAALWRDLLLLQSVIPTGSPGYNVPAWSISAEFWINVSVFYLVVRMRSAPTAILLTFAGYLMLLDRQILDHAHVQPLALTTAAWWRCMAGLCLGFVAHAAYAWLRRCDAPLSARHRTQLATLVELLLCAAMIQQLFRFDLGSRVVAVALMPVAVVVFALQRGALSRLLSAPLLHPVGNYTYGIYLLHYPLLIIAHQAGLIRQPPEHMTLLQGFAALAAVTLLAMPLYTWFELPAKRALRRALTPRRPDGGPARP